MKYLDLTLTSPEANLACDEALLDWCEAGGSDELLRFWESASVFVVLGYANQLAREVHRETCREHSIPVLRRCSGGGTVLQGPGCLNYSLLLRIAEGGPLATIPATNRFVMDRLRDAFVKLAGPEVHVRGHTDLTLGDRKFSGNAQRRKRQFLLFHGSFLLDFDLGLIGKFLAHPPKQPLYRGNRSHQEFLTNLRLSRELVKEALRDAWPSHVAALDIPQNAIAELIQQKYSRDDWNRRF
jgi:lipoate-protein ligase A